MVIIPNLNLYRPKSTLAKLDLNIRELNLSESADQTYVSTNYWLEIGKFAVKTALMLTLGICLFYISLQFSVWLNIDLGDGVYSGLFLVILIFAFRYLSQLIRYFHTLPKSLFLESDMIYLKNVLGRKKISFNMNKLKLSNDSNLHDVNEALYIYSDNNHSIGFLIDKDSTDPFSHLE